MLSNINQNTYNSVKKSGLFNLVDWYVLSFQEYMRKEDVKIENGKSIADVYLKLEL